VANAGGPYTGTATQAIQFDGSRSLDPDGDPLTFAWDFGDGRKDPVRRPRTLRTGGQFTVSLTVSDGRGGVNTASTTAQITSAPPAKPTAFVHVDASAHRHRAAGVRVSGGCKRS
jgi:PKD repeat protein